MWGSLGRLWLGERDGGGCERGAGGVLLDQKLGCEAAALYLIDTHFGDMDLMSPSSKHYRTKDGGGCYSTGRPEGEGSAGLVRPCLLLGYLRGWEGIISNPGISPIGYLLVRVLRG
jgi:hypothetical protein